MNIETQRLIITEFQPEMAEAVHLNSLDEDTRRFVPDEVFETVEEAAAFVGLSPSRFQHLYQQYFKISYINDRIRSKMFRARSLLKDTDWTVARIAQHLGYETEAFFSRQFKQRNGVSPAVYRKMNV